MVRQQYRNASLHLSSCVLLFLLAHKTDVFIIKKNNVVPTSIQTSPRTKVVALFDFMINVFQESFSRILNRFHPPSPHSISPLPAPPPPPSPNLSLSPPPTITTQQKSNSNTHTLNTHTHRCPVRPEEYHIMTKTFG